MAGEPRDGVVAGALGNAIGKQFAPFGGGRGFAAAAITGCDPSQQPVGRSSDSIGGIYAPSVPTAARVNAGRRQDVTAVTTNVDVRPNLTYRVRDLRNRHREVEMPAAATSDALNGRRQGAVLALQLSQRGFAIASINVDNEETARMAGRSADIVIGVFPPPLRNHGQVDRRVIEAMSCRRGFSAQDARQDVCPALGKCQGGAQKAISGIAHISYSDEIGATQLHRAHQQLSGAELGLVSGHMLENLPHKVVTTNGTRS